MNTATITIRGANNALVLNVTAPATAELAALVTRSVALAIAEALEHATPAPVNVVCEVRINA